MLIASSPTGTDTDDRGDGLACFLFDGMPEFEVVARRCEGHTVTAFTLRIKRRLPVERINEYELVVIDSKLLLDRELKVVGSYDGAAICVRVAIPPDQSEDTLPLGQFYEQVCELFHHIVHNTGEGAEGIHPINSDPAYYDGLTTD